jgi:nitrite reductase/ring-hydroxylating ferredoxin subunit
MADAERIICPRSALIDGGRAVRFEVERDGRQSRCFVVAYDGEVFAYVNSCPHRFTELDWQPGEVFEDSGLYLICATHGALFEPDGGLCVGGPCQGTRLMPVPVQEVEGMVLLSSGYRLTWSEMSAASRQPKVENDLNG